MFVSQRMLGRLLLVGTLVVFVLGVPLHALAQATVSEGGTTINAGALFADVRGTIETLFGVLVAGIVGFLGWLVKKNLGISIDQKYRDALQSALVNGLHSGFDLVQARADDLDIDVKSELVAKALRYARSFAPAAIRHFGLTDRDLAEMARAQLAKLIPPEAPAQPAAGDVR